MQEVKFIRFDLLRKQVHYACRMVQDHIPTPESPLTTNHNSRSARLQNDEKRGGATDSEGIRTICRKIRLVSQQKKEKKIKNDTRLINPSYLCIVKRTETDNIFSLDI